MLDGTPSSVAFHRGGRQSRRTWGGRQRLRPHGTRPTPRRPKGFFGQRYAHEDSYPPSLLGWFVSRNGSLIDGSFREPRNSDAASGQVRDMTYTVVSDYLPLYFIPTSNTERTFLWISIRGCITKRS